MYSGQALQASTMVGRDVLVSSSAASVAAGGGISGVVEVPVSTSQVGVSIYDQAGQLVRRMTLGDQAAGQSAFAWDGRNTGGDPVASGVYFIEADILYEGQAVAWKHWFRPASKRDHGARAGASCSTCRAATVRRSPTSSRSCKEFQRRTPCHFVQHSVD